MDLMLGIRQDGSIESAVAVKGHPLLNQAALNSAYQSQFECRGCGETVTSQRIVYTFQLAPTMYCGTPASTPGGKEPEQLYPQIIQSQNHITVVDQPIGTCDTPIAIPLKVRSARCLYLWKCGVRYPL
jgi:hypothetical protein